MSGITHELRLKTVHSEEDKKHDFWKIGIEVSQGRETGAYEIFLSGEFVSDILHLPSFPNKKEAKKVAENEFRSWFSRRGKLPNVRALVVTNKGKVETDEPERLFGIRAANQRRINVNLPPSLYERVKSDAEGQGTSISELIRLSLVKSIQEKKDETTSDISRWLAERRKKVVTELEKEGFYPAFLELTHYLQNPPKQHFNQTTLLNASRESQLRHTGWPIGLVLNSRSGSPKSMPDGVETEYVSKDYFQGFDYWYLRDDGLYYFARTFHEDNDKGLEQGSVLYFDTRVWRISEALEHTAKLYQTLGVNEDSLINIKITLSGLRKRRLSASNPRRTFSNRFSSADQAIWETSVSQKDLNERLSEYVNKAAKQIFVLFDFFEPPQEIVDSIFAEYKNSRM